MDRLTLMRTTRAGDGEVEVFLSGNGSARLRVPLVGDNDDLSQAQKRQAAELALRQAEAAAIYLRDRLASTSPLL